MGLWDSLFGTDTRHQGVDERDTQRWDNYQHGEQTSREDVRRAWHQAREDARHDPRSSDPRVVSRTGDWDKR